MIPVGFDMRWRADVKRLLATTADSSEVLFKLESVSWFKRCCRCGLEGKGVVVGPPVKVQYQNEPLLRAFLQAIRNNALPVSGVSIGEQL